MSQSKTEISPVISLPATLDNYKSFQKKTISAKVLKTKDTTLQYLLIQSMFVRVSGISLLLLIIRGL